MFGLNPSTWAGLMPNGLGQVKPNHYWEMVRTAWDNRDQLRYAWRILNQGVCDGCALGTTGMRDFTLPGVHLCTVRLGLLRLNTMRALEPAVLSDVDALRRATQGEEPSPLQASGRGRVSRPGGAALRALGRLPYPFVRRRGDPGFTQVTWDAALDVVADRIRATTPERLAFYLTSRGVTNETYYMAQKAARFLGTNNVDNSSRVCHAPSTTGLKQSLGVAASTCSYQDWLGTDLLVLIGSDVPNNQPVTTKYMVEAKRRGTKIVVINPFREPGLERYWVPSVLESAVFGTRLADRFFEIHTGGDVAFLNGVLKHLIENDWLDRSFIAAHATGFDLLTSYLRGEEWEGLERASGTTRETMLEFARLYGEAKTSVFVWSMGITQHRYGVDNVRAIANLALSRGMVGRERCGLMPIRGHSGVQGGAEVGAVPWNLPGGDTFTPEAIARFEALWGFAPPAKRGFTAVEMIDAAHRGELDVLYSAGGNFLETLPEPDYVREALERVPLRVHQDIVLSSQMLADPADTVVLLPAMTRYEQPGGGTETSTERRIYFSPEIAGPRIGETKPEWQIFMLLAERVRPSEKALIHVDSVRQIMEEIAKAVPSYDGIQRLQNAGDAVQWGGRLLCEGGRFPTEDGVARFAVVQPPEDQAPPDAYLLSTRRGKQFNSMVQADRDPLTGARRADVLISGEDAAALGLGAGDPVVLRSKAGELHGQAFIAPIKPHNVQVHWPEGNVLIERGACDPLCGIPDYNTYVTVERLFDVAQAPSPASP